MRYTDNPIDGFVTVDYPAYGGAYFDCVGFCNFIQTTITDIKKNKIYNSNGSDSLALKIMISKKNYENITQKFGFGVKYPSKILLMIKLD